MSISNHILSDIFYTIRIRIRIRTYENKYDISDIRPYPIRFHPEEPWFMAFSEELKSKLFLEELKL
jgi:hypothetical protein